MILRVLYLGILDAYALLRLISSGVGEFFPQMLRQSGGNDQQRKRVPPWRDLNALGSLGKEQRKPWLLD